MADLPWTPQVLSILNGLVEERAGVSCSLSDLEIFASKASARAIEAGFDSLLDYYYYLRYDEHGSEELERLIEALVVHETYFFRELEPLQVLVEHVVAPLVAANRRPRIWCTACATGEEPLTLAMLLASANLLDRVQLVASDVSARVLARARASDYGVRALRTSRVPRFAQPYLKVEGTRVQVAPELLTAIDWRQINLVDDASVTSLGEVDAIICRNVLIYFREERVRQVVRSLAARLPPDGTLLIGVSESVMRLSSELVCQEHGGVFFYRKVSP